MNKYQLASWQPNDVEIVPSNITTPTEIASYAIQLSARDKKQVTQGFEASNYEMVINHVWIKSMAALKRELSTVGISFLGEMLNKSDLTEDDDVFDAVTDKEAVQLAEELGIVTSTEAMRLRHVQELVTHFSQIDAAEIDDSNVSMDQLEATQALKTCVKNILGRPKIEVAKKFVDFRDALESETLGKDDDRVKMLYSSPYFFRKLTVSILLSVIKKAKGAKLENALANLILLLPELWKSLRDTEKWQVGHTYAEVYAAGQSTAMGGLQQALLKVKGFDYVPENLRSDTFTRAAENVIKAHESFNNFYNEDAPMKVLAKLGSSIPMPAFSICASAILAVRLGNHYGNSWYAAGHADQLLDGFTKNRWEYYLNQCLPSDIRILLKLEHSKPREVWYYIVEKYDLVSLTLKNKDIMALIAASSEKKKEKVVILCAKITRTYYGNK